MSFLAITVHLVEDDGDRTRREIASLIIEPEVGPRPPNRATAEHYHCNAQAGRASYDWRLSSTHFRDHGWAPLVRMALADLKRKDPRCQAECP